MLSPSYVQNKRKCIILPRFTIGSKNKRLSINVPKIHYDMVVSQLELRLRIEAADLDRQECLSLTFRIVDNLTWQQPPGPLAGPTKTTDPFPLNSAN